MIFLVAICALFSHHLAPYDPNALNLASTYQAPGLSHPLGTDEFGRDVLSRIIFGSRVAMGLALTATLAGMICGILLGLISGYRGGWIDGLIMRCLDVLLSFPSLILAIGLVAFLGPSITNIILVVAITYAPRYARLIRGAALSIREEEYITAIRALGMGEAGIAIKHVLPNCIGPILVYASLNLGTTILVIAGLSFLGLGVPPPTADWGGMLARGRENLVAAPWVAVFPGVAILVTVMGFNLLGDGLRDVLDPRMKD